MGKKKSNINSDDEIITKTITLLTLHLRDTTLLFADFYDKQCKLIRKEFDNLIDNEPPKIFRKAHKEWEQEKERLLEKYDETFKKYLNECQDLEELMNYD